MFYNPVTGFPEFAFDNRRPKMSFRKKVAVGIISTGAVLGGCNGLLAKTDHMKVTDPNKYTYDQANPYFARLNLFGKAIFYSSKTITDADKLNSEGFPFSPIAAPSYKPNAQFSDTDMPIIYARLQAKAAAAGGLACPPDAISVVPINRETATTTSLVSGTEPALLDVRICPDYAKSTINGKYIVVPLALENRNGGTPQKIDESVRSGKCVKWAIKNAEIVNRDIISEMQAVGLQTHPGDQYPVIIHMNAEKPSPCDTDSSLTPINQR